MSVLVLVLSGLSDCYVVVFVILALVLRFSVGGSGGNWQLATGKRFVRGGAVSKNISCWYRCWGSREFWRWRLDVMCFFVTSASMETQRAAVWKPSESKRPKWR